MYVIVQHRIIDLETAFPRGEKLIRGEAAPEGVRNLQFYPSIDGDFVTSLWQAPSVEMVQKYADATLQDAADNTCYQVDADQAFARLPLGLRDSAARAS